MDELELMFLAMDIPKETEKLLEQTKKVATKGMTENEVKAYEMGIENTITLLKCVLELDEMEDEDEFVVHINGLEMPTEYTNSDLVSEFLED